jgi:hypothetical protein
MLWRAKRDKARDLILWDELLLYALRNDHTENQETAARRARRVDK